MGPLSLGINGDKIKQYAGGIFNDTLCPTYINHAVLGVGYGKEKDQDYWIVKNSWGNKWGEQGYIKMIRNYGNQCGIASQASYPTLK